VGAIAGSGNALRRAHNFAIDMNPSYVQIIRTKRVRKQGGFEEQVTTLPPIKIRLYQTPKYSLPRRELTVAGEQFVDPLWGLLAYPDADLDAGPDVVDEFDYPGIGRLRIMNVTPMIADNLHYGYQADLNRHE
jgi:hypothetical protein